MVLAVKEWQQIDPQHVMVVVLVHAVLDVKVTVVTAVLHVLGHATVVPEDVVRIHLDIVDATIALVHVK